MKTIGTILAVIVSIWLLVTIFKLAVVIFHWALILGIIGIGVYVVYSLFGQKNPQSKE